MHTLTHPIPTPSIQPHTERGSYIIELKRRYEAGTLLDKITPDMITEMLISALFDNYLSEEITVH